MIDGNILHIYDFNEVHNNHGCIINKRTEYEPSLLVAAEGRCDSQCRQYAMQHSEHVGQHDGTPHDGALSAQRYIAIVHKNNNKLNHTAWRNKTKKVQKKF